MTVLLIAAAGVLTVAMITSVIIAVISGETRVLLLAGLFLLLGVPQGVALWQHWGQPLALDLGTAAAAASLAAGLLGLAAVVGIARTLRELNHAEELHWESMESVRGLSELAARRSSSLEDRLPNLLEMTCRRFGLEIGLVSRVSGDRYEVIAIHAPPDFPVAAGAVLALDETYCRATLESQRPVFASEHVDARRAERVGPTAFRFETYLASAIQVGGESFGTLVFASTQPTRARLTATHKDLVYLMSQWIGWELELARSPKAAPAATRPRVRQPDPLERPRLRVDALLRRIERRVRHSVPSGIKVDVNPGSPELPTARELRLPLEAIVMSLVRRAAAAMPEGGTLRIEASAQEPAAVAPGVLPAVAPSRYVTLAISESSGGLDPDAIARTFEVDSHAEADPFGEAGGGIPLSTIYRMLQRAGGDLSIEVEPGRGSRFTLFLPLADGGYERPSAASREARATPPLSQAR